MKQTNKRLQKELEIFKRNGLTINNGVICLGSAFQFDFTAIQKLNVWYRNNVEKLEKENKECKYCKICERILHEHRKEVYLTCEETCWCWDLEAKIIGDRTGSNVYSSAKKKMIE